MIRKALLFKNAIIIIAVEKSRVRKEKALRKIHGVRSVLKSKKQSKKK